jgi:putative endopeptidase
MRNPLQFIFLFNLLAFVFFSCQTKQTQTDKQIEWDKSAVDSATLPANNFYQFVNGKWIAKTRLLYPNQSADRFLQLQQETDSTLFALINQIGSSKQYPSGSDAQKVFQFFKVGLDTTHSANKTDQYFKQIKESILSTSAKSNLTQPLLDDISTGATLLFDMQVLPDATNPKIAALYVKSVSTGLPAYHLLSPEATAKDIRMAYYHYLVNLLLTDNIEKTRAEAWAAITLKTEVELAKAITEKQKTKNSNLSYNRLAKADFTNLITFLDLNSLLDKAGIKADTILTNELHYISFCNTLISKQTIEESKAYFYTTWLRKAAPYQFGKWAALHHQFYNQTLGKENETKQRWKIVLADANQLLGDAIAQLYVKNRIGSTDKLYLAEIAENIRFTLAENIKLANWLSDSSKQKALNKLKNIRLKLPYPDKYQDYVGLAVRTDSAASYLENVMLIKSYLQKKQWTSVGQKVNPDAWTVTPQTINAFYDHQRNEIVFPAALLQEPFYYRNGNNAWNYGTIANIMAHEFCHAFDPVGLQYNQEGKQEKWLNDLEQKYAEKILKETEAHFSNNLPNISSSYFLQTRAENFADLAGIDLAYNALLRFYRDNPEKKAIDTGQVSAEQYFFIAYASAWRSYTPPAVAKQNAITTTHSLPEWRVNKSLQNSLGFQSVFKITPNQVMYMQPEGRIKIWN